MQIPFYTLLAVPGILPIVLFGLLWLSYFAGRAIGRRWPAKEGDDLHTNAFGGVIFSLMGLLLAFNVSAAASRFEHRANLLIDEANAVGTAQLRLELLPIDAQVKISEMFRRYGVLRGGSLDRAFNDFDTFRAELRETTLLQQQIWSASVAASKAPGAHPDAGKLLLPALNEVIDITTTRAMQTQLHTPAALLLTLLGVSIVATLMVGAGAKMDHKVNRIALTIYCIVVALALSLILDLEYPRAGLIRITDFEQTSIRFSKGQI